MRITKFTKAFALSLVVMLSLSACNLFGGSPALTLPAEEVLKKMQEAMAENIKTLGFNGKAAIKIDGPEGQKADLSMEISGKADKEKDDSMMKFSVSGSIDDETQSGEFKAELEFAQISKDFYFKLGNLKLPAELAMYSGMIGGITGKWYKIPKDLLPPEAKQAMDTSTNKELEEKIREFMKKTLLFASIKDAGTQGGLRMIEAEFHRENLKQLLAMVAKEQGQEISASELADLDKALDLFKHKFTLGIGDDYIVRQTNFVFSGTDPETNSKFEFNVDANLTDINQPQDIAVPEYEDFSALLGAFGAFGGGLGAPGAVPGGIPGAPGDLPPGFPIE